MGVGRHRDLDVGVADDLPDHVRRHAQVEQETTHCVSKVVKPYVPSPAAGRYLAQLPGVGCPGSIGSAAAEGKTNP